jgi:hypothetical protein
MDGMVGDATLEANDRGNPAAGPHVSTEAIGFGPTLQSRGPAGQLFDGSPAGGPRAWSVPQAVRSYGVGPRHPLAESPLADAQGCGHLSLGPALLAEVPGVQSSDVFPIVA